MNRSDLAKAIAHEVPDLSAATAELMLAALPRIMHGELTSKGEFHLLGIGSFHVHDTKPTKGRNFKTGEQVDVPAGKRIAFRVGKAMKMV